MKTLNNILLIFMLSLVATVVNAQNILVVKKNGNEYKTPYTHNTIRNQGIETESGEFIEYSKIQSVKTSDFKAYKRASKIIRRRGHQDILVEFTGDKNLYALEMDDLQEKRNNAHAARGAGGLLALIGALSGDRDLYNVGMVTYGVGTIAKDINTENTLETQNDAIIALQNQAKQQSEEENLRKEYGNENVNAVIALIEFDYKRAKALASAGETSKDANHRLSAMYIQALIAVDMNDEVSAKNAFEKLVDSDPEIDDQEMAAVEIEALSEKLNGYRNMP